MGISDINSLLHTSWDCTGHDYSKEYSGFKGYVLCRDTRRCTSIIRIVKDTANVPTAEGTVNYPPEDG